MKILICQLNPTIDGLTSNKERILAAIDKAHAMGAELVICPELAISGYPPRDLLADEQFLNANQMILKEIIGATDGIGLILGFIEKEGEGERKILYNSAALIENGKILGVQRKQLLPSYDVFDETRYFNAGQESRIFNFRGTKLGISICEDAWNDPALAVTNRYDKDPIGEQLERGAELLINIAASPYWQGKHQLRRQILAKHAKKHRRYMIFVNQVGANDELIFDGHSLIFSPAGELVHEVDPFLEELFFVDLDLKGKELAAEKEEKVFDREQELLMALTCGTKDYLRKAGFKKCVLGLSGGIDSAVTAAIAVEALGPSNVLGLSMPASYTSQQSIEDAAELALRLGIEFKTIDIDNLRKEYLALLADNLPDIAQSLVEENIQARIRGNILMAFSNKYNYLCLSTGNKSELAVGYCTLYGDMAGGLGIISDLYKTTVYQLANYINSVREVIPKSIIDKEPSAELKENQKDSDSLPDYQLLDKILIGYLEKNLSIAELLKQGFDRQLLLKVIKMVDHSEYKRRQMAVGLKVSAKAFGSGRRLPIARGFSFV